MATLPSCEGNNRLLKMARPPGTDQPDCGCACCAGPAFGIRAQKETFDVLLPGVKRLTQQLNELAEAGRLADIDLGLLHTLGDWMVASRAEIDAPKDP